ncbi:MAG: TOBE domain-containing protein, partial [Alphaproteobacteria bacterium]
AIGAKLVAAIRPESIAIARGTETAGDNCLAGTVETLLFIGDRFECHVRAGGLSFLVYVPRSERLREGDAVTLQIPKDALTLWPK